MESRRSKPMNTQLFESRGELQDRLDHLRSDAQQVQDAGRSAKQCTEAAQAVVTSATGLARRSENLVDATTALQSLPPAVAALRAEVPQQTDRVLSQGALD